jgi:hypothetical protein
MDGRAVGGSSAARWPQTSGQQRGGGRGASTKPKTGPAFPGKMTKRLSRCLRVRWRHYSGFYGGWGERRLDDRLSG